MPITVDECKKNMRDLFGISLNSCVEIGYGAYGTVFKVRYDDHDAAVLRAVKIGEIFDYTSVEREIQALKYFTENSRPYAKKATT